MVDAYADRDDDFGECYVRRRAPTLFLIDWGAAVPAGGGADGDGNAAASAAKLDVAAPTVARLGGVPPGLAVGDASWSPDGAAVAFAGRPAVGGGDPAAPAFQPGLRFCYNRPSAVYVAAAPGGGAGGAPALTDVVRVSGEDCCARSPRFHPSGGAVVWLATPWTGAHASASVVRVAVRRATADGDGWTDAPVATVVGVVPDFPPATSFPGLFAHALPAAPWLRPDSLLVNSAWGARSVVLRYLRRVDRSTTGAGGDDPDGDADTVAPSTTATAGLPADAAAIQYAPVEPDAADVADAFHVVLLTPHGGFLGAHLSARYPATYATAVLRNPVVDVASMAGGTDILDWCYAEAGVAAAGGVDGPASGGAATYPVPLAALTAMWHASPVAWIGRAAAAAAAGPSAGTPPPPPPPTLLQVGGSDRRVPQQQSREWARCVRGAGGVVATRHYATEAHAIDGVGGGDDAMVHALAWLWTHLG
ncbi:hypothetical protein I4F81_004321 [Pyropia yezoensis]|uniref:Uncharacterized protein n=1 Tax=Pyropia yezoensis TaxID=2788 RepID=A0ACC3BW90_PYRYE|nr:hypothetical protein I4F81_004321 [Neopyropia yezoensis]